MSVNFPTGFQVEVFLFSKLLLFCNFIVNYLYLLCKKSYKLGDFRVPPFPLPVEKKIYKFIFWSHKTTLVIRINRAWMYPSMDGWRTLSSEFSELLVASAPLVDDRISSQLFVLGGSQNKTVFTRITAS